MNSCSIICCVNLCLMEEEEGRLGLFDFLLAAVNLGKLEDERNLHDFDIIIRMIKELETINAAKDEAAQGYSYLFRASVRVRSFVICHI